MAEVVVRSRRNTERTTVPDVAVCVSTHGRANLLPRLVAALEAQTLPAGAFEVILVDDGSVDDTWKTIEAIVALDDLDIVAARRPTSGGPAIGRNMAWRMASAPVIAFTDDDCQPDPGWLRAGLDAIEHAPIVTGRTIPDPAQEGRRGPFSRTLLNESVGFVPTANAFYRRADLETADGFDERFPTPGGEDTDLAWRLADEGRVIAYADTAIVRHDISASSLRPALRTAWRWHGLPRVMALHPLRVKAAIHHKVFWKPSHPPTILALVGLCLALRWRVGLAFVLPWLRYRWSVAPLSGSRRERAASLPGAFAIDVTEVLAMVRGSVRERSLLL